MRLIDADAFIAEMNDRIKDAINWGVNAIIEEGPNKDEIIVLRAAQTVATLHEVLLTVEKMPTIDAEPIRHGHWIHLSGDEWHCSECGFVINTEGSWQHPKTKEAGHDYCKHCGAKMTRDKLGQIIQEERDE